MLALSLCLPDSLRIEGAVRPDELDPIRRLGRVQPICRPFQTTEQNTRKDRKTGRAEEAPLG